MFCLRLISYPHVKWANKIKIKAFWLYILEIDYIAHDEISIGEGRKKRKLIPAYVMMRCIYIHGGQFYAHMAEFFIFHS